MSDIMGTDDMLALFNGAPIMLQQNIDLQLQQSVDLIGCSELMLSKHEAVPVVILEDGQVALQMNSGQHVLVSRLTSNGEGAAAATTAQFVDSAEQPSSDPAESNLQPNDDNGNSDNLKSILDKQNISHELTFTNVPLSGTEETEKENGDDVTTEIVTVNNETVLKDLVETVTLYKCRVCPFTASKETQLTDHLKDVHLLTGCDDEPVIVSDSENQSDAQNVNSQVTQLVFLCAQCTEAFVTLDQCRDHMIKDHNMIMKPNDPRVQEEPDLLGAVSSVSNRENKPLDNINNVPTTPSDSKKVLEKIKVDAKANEKTNGKQKIMSLKSDPDFEVWPFRCKFGTCALKFRSSETLEIHTACHADPDRREYSCSFCSENFTSWGLCAIHLWKQHIVDVDLFTCSVCETYKTVTRKKLLMHMSIHYENKEFVCPQCGKRFKQKAQMRNHQVTHLNKSSPDIPRWYMSKICEICFKTYADSKCLKKHMQAVHNKLRPYVCQVCGHSSARKAMLQSHIRQHTGEKPYVCDDCPFRTGDHNSLRRHVMRHTGERPYQCPYCSYSSIQSAAFKTHLTNRHPGKEGAFSCANCHFSTVNHDTFVQHLSDHKHNLIATSGTAAKVEVFPENVAAAHLVYHCLGGMSGRLQTDLTASLTSPDGTRQMITIEISPKEIMTTDDEDTANCFLPQDEIDTGGITIPAEPEQTIVSFD